MIILALVIVNIGISAAKAPVWAMPSMFLSGAGAAAGIAMINSVGNLGGFVGPFAIGWLKNVTGGYSAGLYVVGATLAVGILAKYKLTLPRRWVVDVASSCLVALGVFWFVSRSYA